MHLMCGYETIIFKKEILQDFNGIIWWYNNNNNNNNVQQSTARGGKAGNVCGNLMIISKKMRV